ncbi:acetyl-CoA carboxylase biotin carboxyl carrier protein [Millisia brevis]|uniref:acetyl-CoA carboxylase biotin carboxyl carrier protein n=1 Tax=Millisia brevis TaxID=264148 RepID=UPI0008319A93|nr:biotin/lipoyl-containing protein [Millisia brevis]
MNSPADTTPAARVRSEDIAEILRLFEASGWTGLHLKVGDITVSAGKTGAPPLPASAAPAPAAAAPAAPAPVVATSGTTPASIPPAPPAVSAPRIAPPPSRETPIDETGLVAVTAPTVGAFWIAPSPGSPPFVEVGSRVAQGDQLGIVEVMKLMSPVVTEIAGEVVAVRVGNAEMVEFGQPLFLIRPEPPTPDE